MTRCTHFDHRPDCVSCAYERGRADERAAVVAWLRFQVARGGPQSGRIRMHDADAIERGEHLQAPPQQDGSETK